MSGVGCVGLRRALWGCKGYGAGVGPRGAGGSRGGCGRPAGCVGPGGDGGLGRAARGARRWASPWGEERPSGWAGRERGRGRFGAQGQRRGGETRGGWDTDGAEPWRVRGSEQGRVMGRGPSGMGFAAPSWLRGVGWGSVGWAGAELSLGEVGAGLAFSWGGGCGCVARTPPGMSGGPGGLKSPYERVFGGGRGSWGGRAGLW